MTGHSLVKPMGLSSVLKDTLDKLKLFSCVLSIDHQIVHINKIAKKMMQIANDNIDQIDFFNIDSIKSPQSLKEFIKKSWSDLALGDESLTKDFQVGELWLEVSVDIISCPKSSEKFILVQGLDITKNYEIQSENSINTKRLELYRNQAQLAIVAWDKDLKVIDWNSVAETLFELKKEDALNKSPQDLFRSGKEKELNTLVSSFDDVNINHCVIDYQTSDHQMSSLDWFNTRLIDEDNNIIGYTSLIIDVTNDLKILNQSQQSERMNALTSVIGGIVHDFNNILMIILGYTDLISTISEDPNIQKYAKGAYKATEKGMRLATKLNSFLKRKSENTEDITISEVLSEGSDILQRAVGSGVKINYQNHSQEWIVHCNKDDFEDAILNICLNSAYAMNKQGKIDINVSNVSLVASEADLLGLTTGDYVLVKVTDNGCGMDSETVSKVLDPYFTTKGEKGTGLGLCQVYGFSKRCNGNLEIRSYPNHGTSIYLYFPKALVDFNDQKILFETKKSSNNSIVLIVDDDKEIALLYCDILKRHGYNAFAVNSSVEAIAFLNQNKVDLLISDIVMPVMDGYELVKWCTEHYPEVKIQLMSGFNKSSHINYTDDESKEIVKNLLDKPISTHSLVERVWELIDVVYSEHLSTGIKEIDDDHIKLIDMINSLNSVDKVNNFNQIQKILLDLKEYCKYHFDHEEDLMRQYSYPKIKSHILIHSSFKDRMNQFSLDICDKSNDTKSLIKYLISWLSTHIIAEDKKLANHIKLEMKKQNNMA